MVCSPSKDEKSGAKVAPFIATLRKSRLASQSK